MHTFSMAFLITKAGSSLLWWGLHSCCTPLWGDSSGPHRFSHTHSRGPAKKEPSLLPQSFKDEQHVLYPELFAPETHLALFFSPLSWRFRTKTKQLDGADQTTVSFKAQNWIPRRQSKGHLLLYFTIYVWRGHAFVKVSACQSTASVLMLMGRNGTLWCCPRCWSQTAHLLCFIRSSKIHWPSSIAQKGSISKPCPLRLGPGPLSVGKVFVAFVQAHRTQTAARQGQAADLYSRLHQSMAAPAQTQ